MVLQPLRRMVRGNSLLYSLYSRIIGTYSHKEFPNKSTGIFLTGYQRSANSFSLLVLRQLDPEMPIASHGHVVATLKLAKKRGVKTIILIRTPLDAISSSVVKAQPRTAAAERRITKRDLEDYIYYYRYVQEHLGHCQILDFETVTKTPEKLVEEIVALGLLEKPDLDRIHRSAAEAVKTLRAVDRPPETATLASPQKEAKKDTIKEMLLKDQEFNRRLKRAEELYETLSPIRGGTLRER